MLRCQCLQNIRRITAKGDNLTQSWNSFKFKKRVLSSYRRFVKNTWHCPFRCGVKAVNADWSHTEKSRRIMGFILPRLVQSGLQQRILEISICPTETSHHHCPVNAPHQTTLLLLFPLYLKSGMLHTLCDLSSFSIPLSTSSDTVLRSLSPAPSATVEVRPTVLPNGLILMRDLKFTRDMLMARLLFHWRASRCASCSSFRWSRASRRTERNRPDTSCTSGSLACITSLNLSRIKKQNRGGELMRHDAMTMWLHRLSI